MRKTKILDPKGMRQPLKGTLCYRRAGGGVVTIGLVRLQEILVATVLNFFRMSYVQFSKNASVK